MGKTVIDPRQRLLDAGLKLFADRGYAGTSIQEIIVEAGVAKPTLYYYFANKAGLFQAIVDRALDERLHLMREAAPPGKETAEQLVDIIVAVTEFAARKPHVLRLCFAIAFAAPEEFPAAFKKHDKMVETYLFLREIVTLGLQRGVLDGSFTVDELTQSYFHLVQHSTAMGTFESTKRREHSIPLPPKMTPRRVVDLFTRGAGRDGNVSRGRAKRKFFPSRSGLAKALALVVALGLSTMGARAQGTNATETVVPATNYPAADSVAPPDFGDTPIPPSGTKAPPDLADVRAVPPVVRESHPEQALVSPISQYANDPRALDLQTCFQLTAVRDDSLKISLQDVRIAQAQLSQAMAALWPTFTATNQQEFLHYINPVAEGFNIVNGSTITGERNYTSDSHVTMNYTILNGGQNWNNVGANAAAIAAKKQTMARDYQTIYQDVAQAFYNVLQFEGDVAIQRDLIGGLAARVEDLKDRVSLGRSRPSEMLQAQTDLANARATVQQQIGSINAAAETLAYYTGIPADRLKLKDTQRFPSVAQLEYYLRQSGTRPDILSQVESLRQAERNLSVAKGQLWPTVSAQGDYLASQDPTSNQIDGTMSLQISMPIFDGGLILGQIHQNHEMVRESALNVEQLQRTADQDTRTAYVNFNASVAQVVVLREVAVLSAKNLEAQVEDYRRGVVSNLDVLTALQDYQTARQALHNANMQTQLDLINLHVAAGMAARGPNANNLALPSTAGGVVR
jgi:outer membrane protein